MIQPCWRSDVTRAGHTKACPLPVCSLLCAREGASSQLPNPATMPIAYCRAFLPRTAISMEPYAEINASFYKLSWSCMVLIAAAAKKHNAHLSFIDRILI